jgi:hypothetical protein
MEHGQIVEKGSHAELLAVDGVRSALPGTVLLRDRGVD